PAARPRGLPEGERRARRLPLPQPVRAALPPPADAVLGLVPSDYHDHREARPQHTRPHRRLAEDRRRRKRLDRPGARRAPLLPPRRRPARREPAAEDTTTQPVRDDPAARPAGGCCLAASAPSMASPSTC